jgi:tetratricopeptide (TPR) repeat protein
LKSAETSGTGFAWIIAAAGLAAVLAAAGCSATEPDEPDNPEIERLEEAARSAFDVGQIERAARYFQRLLEVARSGDDAALIGDTAFNLAVCHYALGRMEQALAYLGEARAELDRCGESPADALLLEARIARHKGRAAEAGALCRRIVALPEEDAETAVRVQAHVIEVLIACDSGDAGAAETGMAAVNDLLSGTDDPAAHARAARASGSVRSLRGDHAAAAADFDREAGAYRDAGRFHEMARALVRAGEAHREAGDHAAAADRLFRAARSLAAQGETAAAGEIAQRALAAAGLSGNGDLVNRCRNLMDELTRQERVQK